MRPPDARAEFQTETLLPPDRKGLGTPPLLGNVAVFQLVLLLHKAGNMQRTSLGVVSSACSAREVDWDTPEIQGLMEATSQRSNGPHWATHEAT
jgi:hypothetical protein